MLFGIVGGIVLVMVTFDALVVSSRYSKWLTEQLQDGHDFPVIQDHGLYAPKYDKRVAWWTPQEHYLHLELSGLSMPPVIAPNDSWLSDNIGIRSLMRSVYTMRVGDFLGGDNPLGTYTAGMFIKPANFKCPKLPAQWVMNYSAACVEIENADLPENSYIQISDRWLDIQTEYRCFMWKGHCVAVSPYDGDPNLRGLDEVAGYYAESVLRSCADYPLSFVLDVARTAAQEWVVVEANPAWSSNPYECRGKRVVDAILSANSAWIDSSKAGKFLWIPDPYLVREVNKKLPLPLLTPHT